MREVEVQSTLQCLLIASLELAAFYVVDCGAFTDDRNR